MKLFANKNIPRASVLALRDAGYDVVSLSETAPGMTDETALALAREQGRILMTFDRDYGNLVYGRGLPSPPRRCVFALHSENAYRARGDGAGSACAKRDWD